MKNIYLLLLLVPLVFGCQKKINGSSETTFQESVRSITKSLSQEKAKEFEQATLLIYSNQIDFAKVFSTLFSGEKIDSNAASIIPVYKALHGKSADEVISMAKKIQEEIDLKNKQQAKIEIDELYASRDKSLKDLLELSKMQVLKSRFFLREGYLGKEPIIDLIIKNGTSSSISRVFFKSKLASPNRAVPWFKEDFNYIIPGGLEPNEEKSIFLSPNEFTGNWKVDAPKDAVFTVQVVEVYGADEKSLYASNFSDENKERLEALLKSYPEYRKN